MQLELPLYDKVPVTYIASKDLQPEFIVAFSSQVAAFLHLVVLHFKKHNNATDNIFYKSYLPRE